jgi:DNA polymerase-3 subunit delta
VQISAEQLARQLASGLRPVYVVHGGEPLQTGEVVDAIRAGARGRGFSERLAFEPVADGDWAAIETEAASPSLFAPRRLLEVRLPGSRPGNTGAAALTRLAGHPAPDVLLLVVLGKLESKQRGAAWLEALDRAGVSVPTRPVAPAEMPSWATARARRAGLELTAEAAALLSERTQGNLLACAQEIEKLALLHPGARVDAREVLASAGESARYDVFDLVDGVLAGDARRSARVLQGLRGEGVEPPLVVWALAREVRTMAAISRGLARGEPAARLFGRYRVWEGRKPAVRAALDRHDPERWLGFLRRLGRIDRMIKGLEPADPWVELSRLALAVAGKAL